MDPHLRVAQLKEHFERRLPDSGVVVDDRITDLLDREVMGLARQNNRDHGRRDVRIGVGEVLRQSVPLALPESHERLGQARQVPVMFEEPTDLRDS